MLNSDRGQTVEAVLGLEIPTKAKKQSEKLRPGYGRHHDLAALLSPRPGRSGSRRARRGTPPARLFVADIVLYHEEDKMDPALAVRVIAHEPDCVFWFTPKGDDCSVIGTISDAGIRVVCIIDRPVKTRAPQYVISRRRSL